MRIKCDYCNGVYEDNLNSCPHCGAPNSKRNEGDIKPRTIEELKQWYKDRNLPPEDVTRFFIGTNYTEPKAFGIYKNDNGEFVVYKNKADGTRAIRYQGKDEEYAVNELWQKLKDEIVNQKHLNEIKREQQSNNKYNNVHLLGDLDKQENTTKTKNKKWTKKYIFILLILLVVLAIPWIPTIYSLITDSINTTTGYYLYEDNYYYYDYPIDEWYSYNNSNNYWENISAPDFYKDDEKSRDFYYLGKENTWDSSKSFSDENSSHSQDVKNYTNRISSIYINSSSSSDSGYDWSSSDSWSSSGTNWSSDW